MTDLNQTRDDVTLALKRYSKRATAGFAILVIGIVLAFAQVHQYQADSKARGAAIRSVFCQILVETDRELYADHKNGKITTFELNAGLAATARDRGQVGQGYNVAECYATVTPPSEKLPVPTA